MAQAAPLPRETESTAEIRKSIDAVADRYSAPPLTIDASADAMRSPARQMQNTLGREFAALDDVEPWPMRRTVALVTITCGAFWTGVYFLIAALVG